MTGSFARVFLALPLGAELGNALLDLARESLGGARVEREFRWPRPEGLHLTLFFLGDVERSRTGPLWKEVVAGLGGARAPLLRIGSPGSFPGRGRERVLWFGIEPERSAELQTLEREVLAAAERAGFDTREERARPFHPHVTVARPRGTRGRVSERFYACRLEADWVAAELVLFESVTSEGRSLYGPLETLRLAV